jgi:DNA helicase-2/ATP-dependent DNA helicase PcrA
MADLPPFLEQLNEAQRAAAMHTQGPAMVIAGAGSGKTRVLTYRIAYLLNQKLADPFQLLALTFTNKASREMRERISRLVGPSDARALFMGTFHSIFSRFLRVEAEHLGYTSAFTIYDDDDSQSLVKSIVKELQLDDKTFKPRTIQNRISSAKNHLVSPQVFAEKWVDDDFTAVAAKVYAIYQSRLFQSNAMDFDDLLYNMVVLFEKQPAALYKYQHKFKYVMVDEYQDTNHAQYIITKKLAAVHENLVVVGDDAQSIYSFRGANIENILSFQKDYPDFKLYKLEQNYRSTGIIVSVANEVIAHNKHQIPKLVYTDNEEGELVRVIATGTEQEEAQRVVDTIREQKMVSNFFNRDIAVLYRTNAQSRAIEDGLRRAGITYRIYGGLSFYKRKEVKDVVAYLRLAINAADEEALKRVVNYPARGIGDVTMERLLVMANERHCSLWEALNDVRSQSLGRTTSTLEQFALLIKSFQAVAARETAYEAVNHIAKHSGILKELHKDNSTEGLSRWENVQELINAAREFTDQIDLEDRSLKAFLSEIALFTDQDATAQNDDFVTLMTIHAAKGLEFKSVFVVGLEEGLFPSMMAQQSREDLEEERRLFYVAVTRAEKKLTLSNARSRFRYGSIQYNEPSRFLEEIDTKYLKLPPAPSKLSATPSGRHPNSPYALNAPLPQRPLRMEQRPAITGSDSDYPPADANLLAVGTGVEHSKFGRGTVVRLDGSTTDVRAVIRFEVGGEKTIILKYARLKVLSGG